ncbi:MAG: hypothetical protein ACRER4_01705 [Steroidobacteraceae bacterium]
MNTSTYSSHYRLSAVLAALIVSFGGVALDQSYLASAPAGIVEIGQLIPVEAPAQIAALPEIVVTAPRA